MLIIRVVLDDIQLLGRRFPWKRPESCPQCHGRRLWGHGFVLRYFHGYSEGLPMRRWRCPECRGVHTTRPLDFPAGSAYPVRLCIESLKTKLEGGSFLPIIPRQVQQYWKRAFNFCLGREENWRAGKDFLNECVVSGRRPLSFCLKYHVIPSGLDPPYLDFAVTRGITPIHLR